MMHRMKRVSLLSWIKKYPVSLHKTGYFNKHSED